MDPGGFFTLIAMAVIAGVTYALIRANREGHDFVDDGDGPEPEDEA